MNTSSIYAQLIEILRTTGAHRAVKYISPKLTIKATRRAYRHYKKGWRKNSPLELTLTEGRPNYIEREFIKMALAAGEPFPVRKIQLRYLPVRH